MVGLWLGLVAEVWAFLITDIDILVFFSEKRGGRRGFREEILVSVYYFLIFTTTLAIYKRVGFILIFNGFDLKQKKFFNPNSFQTEQVSCDGGGRER